MTYFTKTFYLSAQLLAYGLFNRHILEQVSRVTLGAFSEAILDIFMNLHAENFDHRH